MCDTRRLTPRELATIRAALRLWLDVPVGAIPASVAIELDGAPAADDAQVEELLAEVSLSTVDVWIRRFSRSELRQAALRTRGERPPAPIDVRD